MEGPSRLSIFNKNGNKAAVKKKKKEKGDHEKKDDLIANGV